MQSKQSKIQVIALLLIFLTSAAFSQSQSKSYILAGISVEGSKFADEQTLISLSGMKIGEQISIPGDNRIHQAIKNIWARKQFSDVEIVVDKVTTMGVFLVIKVKEYPRLSYTEIFGNSQLTSEEIRKTLNKSRGDIMSPYEVYMLKHRIKKLYSDEGLLFAKIDASLEATDTAQYSWLMLTINEGAVFHTASIEFIGNSQYSNSELAGTFDDTHTKHWWEFWRSSKFNTKELDDDKKLLVQFFKKNGYIDGEITKDTIIYDADNEKVHLKFWVDEGKKYYVRNIKFEGNTVYSSEDLEKRLEFKKGDVYDLERFQMNLMQNQEQTDALSMYLNNGYLFAAMKPEEKRILPDSIDITIRVEENNRVTLRKIDIIGNTKTKDKVIRRELYTRPGDYFNRAAIIRSVSALNMLNYFNPEALRPDIHFVDNTKVDLIYKVEERSTDTFNASIGFAGSYGLTGSVGFSFNNFSITEPFKGGAGQNFSFAYEFGQASRIQNVSLGFTEPWLFDEPTTVGFSIFDSRYNYYYNIRRTGVAMNLGRRFRWPDDYWRGDWSLRIQQNDISEESSTYYRSGIYTEITIGQSFSRVSLNNQFFPTSGSRFSLSTNWAMGSIGLGSVDYLKNEFRFELAQPLMQVKENDRVVLFLSSYLGYITGLNNDTTISPIELYYMGGNGLSGYGVTPLRGYDDQAVGPDEGGKVIAKHVAELRFAVSLDPMPIYVYGFAEAGNVWSNFKYTDPFTLKRAAGLGLQLMVQPIGLIGFSYGYGFDKDDQTGSTSGWKFLFHLGNQ